MLNHELPDSERREQETQLRQFLAWLTPIVFGFVPLLGIAFATFGRVSFAIASMVLLGYGLLLLYVRAQLRPTRLEAAVAAICSGLFLLVLLLKLTEPLSPATLAVVPLLAVILALPYVGARVLRRLLFVAWLMALTVALLNEIAAPVAGLPLWVSVGFRAGSFAVVVGLLLLLVWQFQQHLAATLARSHAANTALRESEELYRALFEQANDAIFLETEDDKIIDANQQASVLTGYSRAELLTMSVPDLQAPEVRGQLGTVLRGELTRHSGSIFEGVDLKKDGTRVPVEISNTRLISKGQTIIQSVVRDVTERKQAEQALRQAEIKYRTLVEQIPAITYMGREEATSILTYVSPQIETILGFTPAEWLAEPRPWERQIHPEDYERVMAASEHSKMTGEPFDIEYRLFTRDGRTVWLHDQSHWIRDDAGRIRSYQGVAFDITERKQAEEAHRLFERRLLETQKLESLAVLAGGIAHDFNNILAIILGNVDLARIELPPDSSIHGLLSPVVGAVQRASGLTQQMLAYSGKGHFLLEQIHLNELLRDLHEPIRVAIGARARAIYQLAPQLPSITADPSQIRQAVLNLVINAAEAIGEAAGTVTIRTSVRSLEPSDLVDAYLAPDPATSRYVVLEVADTGSGMDEATLARIFEPFFTTRFMGRGLGLAAVLGIVRGHHGGIQIRSAPGQGSTFTILLPATES
jgi:PAS domain S-box-containing protein